MIGEAALNRQGFPLGGRLFVSLGRWLALCRVQSKQERLAGPFCSGCQDLDFIL